jgi:flavin-dependent dehydrogenase
LGARVLPARITDVKRIDGRLQVQTKQHPAETYDLLAVGAGVNTPALRLFENRDFNYEPPATTKTALREYFLGTEAVEKYLGNSLHVFLLDISGLTFGMAVPKGEYVTLVVLGRDVDEHLIRAFASAPEVRACFPPDWDWDRPSCHCMPRIPVSRAIRPYADRLVFVGDCGVSRLYKDGLGAAYRAAKAAAATAIFSGISEEDFRRHYEPACKALDDDNRYGKAIFAITRLIQKTRFSRAGLMRMASGEQAREGQAPRMSSVLWDTFTGSAPYRDIFLRSLSPAFLGRYVWNMAGSLLEG